jgi:hypothetical protein
MSPDAGALSLFLILFVWQYQHFDVDLVDANHTGRETGEIDGRPSPAPTRCFSRL